MSIYSKLYLPHPQKGEKVEIVLRRHTFIIVTTLVGYAFLIALPWGFQWFLQSNFLEFFNNPLVQPLLYLAASIYLLFIWLFLYASFIDYYLDLWVITNQRILSIEQKGLFARTFSEEQLYRLQDVSAEVKGFFPTIMRYGKVVVQSAGEAQNSVMLQIPNPEVIARRIMQLVEQSRRDHEGHVAELVKEEVED